MTREEAKKIADFVRSHIHEIITESGTDKNAHTNWVLRFVADGIETLDTEPCEDAISRQAVLDGIDNYIENAQSTGTKDDLISFEELVVKALPSVTPKQKIGRWIDEGFYAEGHSEHAYRCSKCDEHYIGYAGEFKYCPNCDAKMSDIPTGSESEGA